MTHQERLDKNIEMRQELVLEAFTSPDLQRETADRCRQDILFFFNAFLWTYNPRKPPYHFPFVLYPAQEIVVHQVNEAVRIGDGTLGEKSRDWGATYIWLGVFLYHFLFFEFEGLLLSLRQTEVDNPTPSSLFGKLRYMMRRLPFWLLPRKWSWRRDGDTFLRILNPDNGNSIIGQATTEDAGRSGRKTAVLVDEYAAIRNRIAEGMERSLAHNTESLHRLSTPRGINLFKTIRDRRLCQVITMHWTQIPDKTADLYYLDRKGERRDVPGLPMDRRSAYGNYIDDRGRETEYKLRSGWYDKQERIALTARDLAQEVDISYVGSGYCRFDAAMLEEKSKEVQDGKRGRLVERDGRIEFIESEPGQEYEIEIWQFPREPKFFNRSIIGVDTAEGLEHGDFNCADIIMKNIRGDQGVHAASLHGHWQPDIYADKLDLLGRYYDAGAIMAVERNKDGLGVILRLRNQLAYPTLWHEDEEHEKYGFYTTDAKKHLITGDLDEALRTGELVTRSLNHFTEMATFENLNGKLGASGTNNDDRVIAIAIAWFIAKQLARPRAIAEKTGRVKNYLRTPNNQP